MLIESVTPESPSDQPRDSKNQRTADDVPGFCEWVVLVNVASDCMRLIAKNQA